MKQGGNWLVKDGSVLTDWYCCSRIGSICHYVPPEVSKRPQIGPEAEFYKE